MKKTEETLTPSVRREEKKIVGRKMRWLPELYFYIIINYTCCCTDNLLRLFLEDINNNIAKKTNMYYNIYKFCLSIYNHIIFFCKFETNSFDVILSAFVFSFCLFTELNRFFYLCDGGK